MYNNLVFNNSMSAFLTPALFFYRLYFSTDFISIPTLFFFDFFKPDFLYTDFLYTEFYIPLKGINFRGW